MISAHLGKLECARLGLGLLFASHSRTKAHSAARISERMESNEPSSKIRLNVRSSARSCSMNSSTNKERRRMSDETVQPFPVMSTVTWFSPQKDLLTPRIRPLHRTEVTNASSCAESRCPLQLSSSV